MLVLAVYRARIYIYPSWRKGKPSGRNETNGKDFILWNIVYVEALDATWRWCHRFLSLSSLTSRFLRMVSVQSVLFLLLLLLYLRPSRFHLFSVTRSHFGHYHLLVLTKCGLRSMNMCCAGTGPRYMCLPIDRWVGWAALGLVWFGPDQTVRKGSTNSLPQISTWVTEKLFEKQNSSCV